MGDQDASDVNQATDPNDVVVTGTGTDSLLENSGETKQAENVKMEKPVAFESGQQAQIVEETVELVRPDGQLSYTIIVKDESLQPADFTGFIGALRGILAKHPDDEDICDRHQDTNLSSAKTHPLLAKPRADQQPARWIQVKLEVVEKDNGTTKPTASTTLVMRDDNVDVIGFSNDKGDWYALGNNRRMLPPEFNAVHCLNWGNSYKSILKVANEEEVADLLESQGLGKPFATNAVRVLSSYNPTVANGNGNTKQVLVGLMFMICESAKMNPVLDRITREWDAGKGFTKKLLTDYVRKYVDMSRRLRHWKKGNYVEEQRPDSELRDLYLVLNEEYTTGDLLSHAYPEMLKLSFTGMFKVMSMAIVQVNLRRLKKGKYDMGSVYGKIAALISDKHRDSVYFRVGSMLFTRTKMTPAEPCSDLKPLELARSVVVVPYDWVLHIKVDLHIKIDNSKKHLEYTFNTNNGWRQKDSADGVEVEVDIKDRNLVVNAGNQSYFPRQLSRPVEVRTISGHPTIVYTIFEDDDVMPYSEFIMSLRRIVSDYPGREDILDGHDLLNMCSTREHPVLAKMRSVGPRARWLHVMLQVVEGEEMSSTTLVMRCEDLYVAGFFNQDGVLFRLCEANKNNAPLIPEGYHKNNRELKWGVSYPSILKVPSDKIVAKLREKDPKLIGCSSAKHAVHTLSCYSGDDIGDDDPRKALAYLLIMVCESARMNPIHNSVVDGWSKGTEFTNQMLEDYIWKYSVMSGDLRKWKSEGYAKLKQKEWKCCPAKTSEEEMKKETYPISQLKAIYLVHSGPEHKSTDKGDKSNDKEGENSNTSDKNQKDDNTHGGDGQHGETSSGGGVDPSPPTQQSNEAADEAPAHGRHLVELLAVHADLGVIGTKIIVFDAKRGQIIYRKKKKGKEDQGKVKLEMTGPYRGISAYECFAIEIEIPAEVSGGDATVASSSQQVAAAGDSIIWEWNCYDPGYAAEVDGSPVVRPISSGPGRNVEVTYAVMSNAREATVQVKLRLRDGPIRGAISGGEITALVDGFQDEHKSVLFDSSESTSIAGDSWFLLQLSRDVVAVPCRRGLKIEVTLQIKTCNDQKVKYSHAFDFYNNGICSRENYEDEHGSEVQVNITWYPEVKTATEVVYTIGDDVLSYTGAIADLRRILADHPDREDVLDENPISSLSSTGEHPVLAKQRAEQPARWIHVKLQAQYRKETLWTTLLLRGDNLYVCGFMNQEGDSFELIENLDGSADILPVGEYNPRPRRLCWGVGYRSLLDADTEDDEPRRLVDQSLLNCDFAMGAIYVLSRFPSWVDVRVPSKYSIISWKKMNPRSALAGLIIMFCESARMNPVNKFIPLQWNEETYDSLRLNPQVFNYGRNSGKLLAWKSKGYPDLCPISQLQDICLVLNYRVDDPPQAISEDHGQPRVELLAIRADHRVDGMTVIVYDGKRGQIIYTEKQEEKGTMSDDLVLTGPYTSISAYGCFAIKIDIPPTVAAPGSSKGDAIGSIKWEWDCYDPVYAKEVDKGPTTSEISSGPGRKVKVTYAVMSNALEATVQVKMRCKDWNSSCSVHGLITARIGDFNDKVILFKRTLETAHRFSPTHVNVIQLARSLKLARNVVACAYYQSIEIEMHLNIETSKNQGVSVISTLSFHNNGSLIQHHRQVDGGYEFEVKVDWYPVNYRDFYRRSLPREILKIGRWSEPDISYTVGDDVEGFSRFISVLCRLAADHPRCRDLMANHPELSSTRNHPVLRSRHGVLIREEERWVYQRERLIHIKMEAGEGVDKTSSITLLMRDDNLNVIGLINKDGVCYQLGKYGPNLPPEYGSKILEDDWGPYYEPKIPDEKILGATKLGKTFAAETVRELSRLDCPGGILDNRDRELLTALMVMVCDSARIEPVRDAIASKWDNGAELTEQLNEYRRNWSVISGALLDWRDHAYQGWPQNTTLESMGIKSSEDARKVVHLVFNDDDRISAY